MSENDNYVYGRLSIRNVSEMTDREIAEETLVTLRELVMLANQLVQSVAQNPMIAQMAKIFGG
jgi:hypothetical protein